MDLFLNALKGQVNTLNILILFFALSFIARLLNRRRLARITFGVAVLFFLLTSTRFLPYYLVGRMELAYTPFEKSLIRNNSHPVFIHVLGGGYTFDHRLPSSGQLSPVSLGRLTEGVRIANQVPSGRLVFSGWKVSGPESMAWVMKQAAVSLGVDSSRVALLEESRTTKEEAHSFLRRFSKDVTLILVTDAIHMRRAVDFFRQYGLDTYPAPTNYLAREDHSYYTLKWMPSTENLLLMDRVLREWLGAIKGKIT
jgi:uncharacterized SAM-binding protein YcdF (DUF218 family)